MRNKESWMDNPASGAESSPTEWRENFLNEVSRYSLPVAAFAGWPVFFIGVQGLRQGASPWDRAAMIFSLT